LLDWKGRANRNRVVVVATGRVERVQRANVVRTGEWDERADGVHYAAVDARVLVHGGKRADSGSEVGAVARPILENGLRPEGRLSGDCWFVLKMINKAVLKF
jgi:hypothetical protein